MFPQNGLTFGTEVEFMKLTSESRFPGFEARHDASIETDVFSLNIPGGFSIPAEGDRQVMALYGHQFQRRTLGVEFVTSEIVSMENPSQFKTNLAYMLKKADEDYGEVPTSRNGIHFHVSLSGPNLWSIRKLIGSYLEQEDLIYTLAGLGEVFRGINNSSAYAYPLTGEGIFVPYSDGFAKLIHIPHIFEAKTVSELFERWGDCPRSTGVGRYFPVRYYGLNLSSIFVRGSVEWRMLNSCLNPEWVWAVFKFLQSFTLSAYVEGLIKYESKDVEELNIHSVSSPREREALEEALEKEIIRLRLTEEIEKPLKEIIRATPAKPIPGPKILTHLLRGRNRVFSHFRDTRYVPFTIPTAPPFPKVVDIHSLRGEY